jgi:hypothetical protein
MHWFYLDPRFRDADHLTSVRIKFGDFSGRTDTTPSFDIVNGAFASWSPVASPMVGSRLIWTFYDGVSSNVRMLDTASAADTAIATVPGAIESVTVDRTLAAAYLSIRNAGTHADQGIWRLTLRNGESSLVRQPAQTNSDKTATAVQLSPDGRTLWAIDCTDDCHVTAIDMTLASAITQRATIPRDATMDASIEGLIESVDCRPRCSFVRLGGSANGAENLGIAGYRGQTVADGRVFLFVSRDPLLGDNAYEVSSLDLTTRLVRSVWLDRSPVAEPRLEMVMSDYTQGFDTSTGWQPFIPGGSPSGIGSGVTLVNGLTGETVKAP